MKNQYTLSSSLGTALFPNAGSILETGEKGIQWWLDYISVNYSHFFQDTAALAESPIQSL